MHNCIIQHTINYSCSTSGTKFLINNIHTAADKPRIFLVDDNSDITLTFKAGLEQYGFIVRSFNDAAVALSKFETGTYALLLLDIKVPMMNGFELYEKSKKLIARPKCVSLRRL
jgi:CheY-like chemotaxis protein